MALTNEQIVSQINLKAEEYENLAEASLQELLTIANDKLWNNIGISTANIQKTREISLGSLNDLPDPRPEVNIPAFVFNPEDFLTTDLLQKYSYDSEFFEFLDPLLQTYITSEVAFIDQTVQDALFAQTRERDLQIQTDQLDLVNRQQAQRGFRFPTSISTAARNEVVKQYGDRRSDRNSEITATIAERAQESRLRSMDIGVRMEDIRSRFQLEYGRLYMNAAEWLVRKYQADVAAEVSRVNTEIEQLRLKAQIDQTMVGSDTNWNNTLVAHLAQRVNQLIADAEADLEIQKTQSAQQMEALTEIINFYKDIHAGYTGQMNGVNLTST